MPLTTPGLVTRPPQQPNMPANVWGQFISKLKRDYTPQYVKAQIEDLFPVPSQRDKQAIMLALKDMCNTETARQVRDTRRGLI